MINPNSLSLSGSQIESFHRDGFVVLPNVLSEAALEKLRASFPRIFAGDFDTGIYPDEWHWREGMSLPDVTRHMANAWKSDLAIANFALSPEIGRAATQLTGWSGVRLGQDTIWWKPPNTKSTLVHQDSSFMDYLDPPQTVTCWVTLDDTHRDAGTLEYIPGSHRWPLAAVPEKFHAPDDYRSGMMLAAKAAGVTPPDPVFIEVPAGSATFHAGEIWHGSGANITSDRMRRSIGVHMVPEDARFSDRPGGYIYRRYQITGEARLDESFFPITWANGGYRTPWIEGYCQTGRRVLSDQRSLRPRAAAVRA